MEFSNIPALQHLRIHCDEDSGDNWILLTDFLIFLRQNHRPSDTLREIKKSNIQKELKSHQNGVTEIDGEFRIRLKSTLRYFFNHADNLFICRKIVEQIEKRCLERTKNAEELSILEIYNRSMQICTLPITLKGLPRNALLVDSWHDVEMCDGNVNCECKNDVTLTKEDFKLKILHLNSEESESMNRFNKLYNWGFTELWTEVLNKEIWNTLPIQTIDGTIDNELEVSFASLYVDDNDEILGQDNATPSEVKDDATIPINDNENEIETEHEEEDNFEQIFDGASIELEMLDSNLEIEATNLTSLNNMSLDDSFNFTPLTYDEEVENIQQEHILQSLNFNQFKPLPLLTRHPPPATGKDDDITKLKEILDDILTKTDHLNQKTCEKILFGPDNKIGSNLLKLRERNKIYEHFIPEFPLLHLRKSKINNLCTAYQHAGLIHMFKYMRDDDVSEWKKLINPDHIDKATKYIRRLSLSLHLSFICSYMQTLPLEEVEAFQDDIRNNKMLGSKWEEDLNAYMNKGSTGNATFALHADMMKHCDEICAIALSERLGGSDGYTMLLAAVKSSLPFAFLNGASSYAAFCTKLLHEHYKCGPFYRNMKKTLYTTPHKGSNVNFALDAQREMDHQDVIKAFRSGATMTSVLPRMSLIDTLNEIHETSAFGNDNNLHQKEKSLQDLLGITLTSTDIVYIIRITSLILRRGGISTVSNKAVYNVYESSPQVLPDEILDQSTVDIGQYLIQKFVAQASLFGFQKTDVPNKDEITGPKTLIQKVRKSKGVTVRRIPAKKIPTVKTDRELKEDKRTKLVAKQTKQLDRLSSEMNLCQAIVKPDCSKPKVQKAQGIQRALINLLIKTFQTDEAKIDFDHDEGQLKLEDNGIITLGTSTLPSYIQKSASHATLEFAGVKFMSYATSGRQYLDYIGKDIIMKVKYQLPQLRNIAVCEEKYKFTPDDFKAATRAQRTSKQNYTISHLKTADEVLSEEKFDKKSLTTLSEGKSISSIYLAKNVSSLNVKADIVVDIDSELHMSTCQCDDNTCSCTKFCTPVRAFFDKTLGFQKQELLSDIKQTKGEAEMSQIDWLLEYAKKLSTDESCCSIVSSGDIDAIVLHMFAVSYLWPRTDTESYLNKVFVILRKPNQLYDVYNITEILTMLEKFTEDKYIGMKIAIVLSLGGNDFLPKFYSMSHSNILELFMSEQRFRSDLIRVVETDNKISVSFNEDEYTEFIKYLYCPKIYDASKLTFEEVRQMTIQMPTAKSKRTTRSAQLWMPPKSVIKKLALNIKSLVKYYMTAGHHTAELPDFLSDGCLIKSASGEVEYDFGPESFSKDINHELLIETEELLIKLNASKKKSSKRKITRTPQKQGRWKLKPKASTPKKL